MASRPPTLPPAPNIFNSAHERPLSPMGGFYLLYFELHLGSRNTDHLRALVADMRSHSPARRLSYAIQLTEILARNFTDWAPVRDQHFREIERDHEKVGRVLVEMHELLERAKRRWENPTQRERDEGKMRMSKGGGEGEDWFEVFERDLERLRREYITLKDAVYTGVKEGRLSPESVKV